jgi:hypothetical protein
VDELQSVLSWLGITVAGALAVSPQSITGVRLNVMSRDGKFLSAHRSPQVASYRGRWIVGIGEIARPGDADDPDLFHQTAEGGLREELDLFSGGH